MFLESRMWGHMSTTDLPGSSLLAGRYRLVERLGAGGMSVVWRGFDEVLGRQVAVKVLPPSTSTDPSFRRRLRAEAQAAARLSHPNITNVYDYGEATTVDGEPVPYVVMELVDGESLAAALARVRRLPRPAAVRICAEVSAALAAAHSRGIVHRDVTPANVMLTSSGAKVVDFGISALIGENDIDPDGSLLGTPAYLAPERLEGGQVSPATDVYAVGLLIYRTLIGQLPWDVGTTTALLRAHQYTEPEPLPPVEGLPREVDALVARCLEKRPADRPSSAEVAHVLAGVSAGAPAAHGYVPEWADNGEDTTILPSQHSFTDGLGRVRPGHAKMADATPVRAGRGVASVRGGAMSPAAVGAAAVSPASAPPVDAPISPAPGRAIPVSVSEVRAAVDGTPVVASASPYAALAPAPAQALAPAPALPPAPAPRAPDVAPPAGGRGPGPVGGARNSRFGGAARPAAAAAPAAPAPPVPSASGPVAPLRPSLGNQPDDWTVAPGGGGTPPPGRNRRSDGFDGPGRGRPGRTPGARRIMVMAGTVVLLGVATYAWSLAAGNNAAKSPPQPSALAAVGKCVVSYTVWSDTGKDFKASLTIANRDTVPVQNWNLWFVMPGGQIMSGGGKEKLFQDDRGVTVTSAAALNPQQTKTLALSGRYTESNAAPMVFKLDNQNCETYVSGKPGEPSRPVERLTNGTVRLGPVPTTKNPVPGITIGPGGVAVPVPIRTPTSGPTTAVDPDPTDQIDPSLPPGDGTPSPSLSPTPSPSTTLLDEVPEIPPPGDESPDAFDA